jgi:hypothetical protein
VQNQSDAADGAVSTTVDELERRLRIREYALVGEVAVARAFLSQLVDGVAKRLERIHPLSCQFDGAVKRVAAAAGVDPMAVGFDPVGEELAERLGIAGLYDLAGRLERALPDNCDCSEHGCADLAGIPTGRAD